MNQLILTLAPGRCGTNKLQTLLSTVPGVYAEHEGEPGFHLARLDNQKNSAVGYEFVRRKLEFFNLLQYDTIVHTGHMAGEGFFERFVEHKVVPNTIILRRKPREVALSMFRLDWIPGRNKIIEPWYCGPGERDVLQYDGWEKAHGYQLCYWWVCDTERRIKKYSFKESLIWETTLPQILDISHFNMMLEFFGLVRIDQLSQDKVNHYEYYEPNEDERKQTPPPELLTKLENEVLARIPPDFKDQLEETWKSFS